VGACVAVGLEDDDAEVEFDVQVGGPVGGPVVLESGVGGKDLEPFGSGPGGPPLPEVHPASAAATRASKRAARAIRIAGRERRAWLEQRWDKHHAAGMGRKAGKLAAQGGAAAAARTRHGKWACVFEKSSQA
jgi:hypothetical protein